MKYQLKELLCFTTNLCQYLTLILMCFCVLPHDYQQQERVRGISAAGQLLFPKRKEDKVTISQ